MSEHLVRFSGRVRARVSGRVRVRGRGRGRVGVRVRVLDRIERARRVDEPAAGA